MQHSGGRGSLPLPLDLAAIRSDAEASLNNDPRFPSGGFGVYLNTTVLALIALAEKWEDSAGEAASKLLDAIARAEAAEAKITAVLALADNWERGAMRWEDPLRVPPYVSLVREALGEVVHDPDWGDSVYDDEGPSCSCGFNGTPKECWLSRTALDGE